MPPAAKSPSSSNGTAVLPPSKRRSRHRQKNIVGVVLGCAQLRDHRLGVMVPARRSSTRRASTTRKSSALPVITRHSTKWCSGSGCSARFRDSVADRRRHQSGSTPPCVSHRRTRTVRLFTSQKQPRSRCDLEVALRRSRGDYPRDLEGISARDEAKSVPRSNATASRSAMRGQRRGSRRRINVVAQISRARTFDQIERADWCHTRMDPVFHTWGLAAATGDLTTASSARQPAAVRRRQRMLEQIVTSVGSCKGSVGFWEAERDGDESSARQGRRLHGLSQQ